MGTHGLINNELIGSEARKANRISCSKARLLVRVWMDKRRVKSRVGRGRDIHLRNAELALGRRHRSNTQAKRIYSTRRGRRRSRSLPTTGLLPSGLCKCYISIGTMLCSDPIHGQQIVRTRDCVLTLLYQIRSRTPTSSSREISARGEARSFPAGVR